MHAVGFFHEQSRPDRDEHVTINLENIRSEDKKFNFRKIQLSRVNMVGEYDMCSIMHYGLWDFGRNGKKTIQPKHRRFEKYCTESEIGRRKMFSNEDIGKINALYGCDSKRASIV